MKILFLFVLVFGLSACVSSRINEKADYRDVYKNLEKEDSAKALSMYPKKENSHFITKVEKSYLELLNTLESPVSKNTKELLEDSRSIILNDKTSVSNELNQLLFVETNEGYYPGDHEIFWAHWLLALHLIKQHDVQGARVEAQRISELFNKKDLAGREFYQDATIRVLAGVLWLMVGDKENARVDFTQANIQDAQIQKWLNSEDKVFHIGFLGQGANVEVASDRVVSYSSLKFKPSSDQNSVVISNSFFYPTENWLNAQRDRNDTFKSSIQTTKYMTRMLGSEFGFQSLNFMTIIATSTIYAVGAVIGIGIVGGGLYLLGNNAGTDAAGYVIGLGFLAGRLIFDYASNWHKEIDNKLELDRKDSQDMSRFYRYVRFIPDYFIISEREILQSNHVFLKHKILNNQFIFYKIK